MLKWFFIFIIIVVLLLIYIYNVINANEDKAIFYPTKRKLWKPDIPYKKVFINVNDENDVCNSKERKEGQEYICGWFFNNHPNKPTSLFSHGNSGNISHRSYIINLCHKLKVNLFVYDYRGYGESTGFPHKTFMREDGEAAYKYLRYYCNIPSKEIIVWGESIGGCAATHISSKYNCGGLILLSTFSSLDDAITYRYKGMKKTAAKFLTDFLSIRMDMIPNKECLQEVKCPVVIIPSPKDTMIPYICTLNNNRSIKHKHKLHIKIKGDHSSPQITSNQLKKAFDFIKLPLNDLSSDVDISGMLKDLTHFARKNNNFMRF